MKVEHFSNYMTPLIEKKVLLIFWILVAFR